MASRPSVRFNPRSSVALPGLASGQEVGQGLLQERPASVQSRSPSRCQSLVCYNVTSRNADFAPKRMAFESKDAASGQTAHVGASWAYRKAQRARSASVAPDPSVPELAQRGRAGRVRKRSASRVNRPRGGCRPERAKAEMETARADGRRCPGRTIERTCRCGCKVSFHLAGPLVGRAIALQSPARG